MDSYLWSPMSRIQMKEWAEQLKIPPLLLYGDAEEQQPVAWSSFLLLVSAAWFFYFFGQYSRLEAIDERENLNNWHSPLG